MQTINVTEDTALRLNVSLESLVKAELAKGYTVIHTYTHPAVGKVYVMKKL
jgi:hypothetical protein